MKLCISKIHLGRYRIEMLDENNQVTQGTDGGSALIMVWLTNWIFEEEARQYQIDQRRSSDEIGAEAIARAHREATPAEREFLAKLEAKRANRASKLLSELTKGEVKTNR
jgi:hypothetical protein